MYLRKYKVKCLKMEGIKSPTATPKLQEKKEKEKQKKKSANQNDACMPSQIPTCPEGK